MKRSGFALLVVIGLLAPVSVVVFHMWELVSSDLEIYMSREATVRHAVALMSIFNLIKNEVSKKSSLLFTVVDLDKHPIILEGILEGCFKKPLCYRALIDRPASCGAYQVRLRVQSLGSRTASCLLIHNQEKGKCDVAYFTLSSTV